jgi:hypothetical protein
MRDEILMLGSLINSLKFSKCAGRTLKIDVLLVFVYYCNWVSTWWQWSVGLYKIGERLRKREKITQI